MAASSPFQATDFREGYRDSTKNLLPNQLGIPSKNIRINTDLEAISRMGYLATSWDLAEADKSAKSFYVERYNVTFFSLNGKVKYIEHDRGDAIVDTGLSLTATETTTFAEYAGDVYCINPTDGLRQIHVFRLNDTAPNSGDATFTIDQDGGGRLNAFGDTSGTMRIRGTNEAYSAVTTAGVVTHSTTLSQTYADNDIVITVEDISSGKPKGSKIVFWKERMIIIGVPSATDTDNATQIAFMSQFASARDLQKIIVFGITGGATEEWVGKSGSLKNIVSTRDYLYYFKEGETYFSSVGDVDATSGATFPQLLSNNYGCVNEECAVDLGSGLIAYLTKNKRIMAIKISTDSGAAVVFPDESFDQAIRNTLNLLDDDQSESIMFYHKGKRLLFVQVSVDSQVITLVYDNNIGKWLPPDDNKVFSSYFEKDGLLYATQKNDDTIFEMDNGEQDDGNPFESVIGLPVIEFDNGRTTLELKELRLSGGISETGTIQVENIVNNGTSQLKTIDSSGLSFSDLESLGTVTMGTTVLGDGGTETILAEWDKRFGLYPRYGSSFQCILSSMKPFSLSSYQLVASALPGPILTLS